MKQNENLSIQRRLERIESSVFQIKVILLVTLVVLLLGVFGPSAVVRLAGMTVLYVGIVAGALYAGIRILDVLVKRKMGSDEEREEEILASITSKSETDEPAD
ncbi:MAG: hypothetical protein IT364_02850 [Candidatus Hydrogenedentes bacterium]|nr:hypothetical protein [Candidatus Hydrogenedentota bacterium]